LKNNCKRSFAPKSAVDYEFAMHLQKINGLELRFVAKTEMWPPSREHQWSLVERFVASFEKLDEMTARDHDSVACQLATGDPNQFGYKRWQPTKVDAKPELLEPIYSKLPARFPPTFERLVLSYRWAEIDLQSCRLLANPPGRDLSESLVAADPHDGG
jgi:hypothetical protein